MNTTIRIIDGQIYDPKNSVDGKVQDIYIKDGKIVKESSDKGREINAKGMIVMPGGIDMHSHIAGPKVNLGRKLQPEDHSQDVQVPKGSAPHAAPMIHQQIPPQKVCRKALAHPSY